MAKFKPAQNYTVSGNHLVETVGDLKIFEKRNRPTVNGVKEASYNTYHVSKEVKVPSMAFNGSRIENEIISDSFDTVDEAIAEAIKING